MTSSNNSNNGSGGGGNNPTPSPFSPTPSPTPTPPQTSRMSGGSPPIPPQPSPNTVSRMFDELTDDLYDDAVNSRDKGVAGVGVGAGGGRQDEASAIQQVTQSLRELASTLQNVIGQLGGGAPNPSSPSPLNYTAFRGDIELLAQSYSGFEAIPQEDVDRLGRIYGATPEQVGAILTRESVMEAQADLTLAQVNDMMEAQEAERIERERNIARRDYRFGESFMEEGLSRGRTTIGGVLGFLRGLRGEGQFSEDSKATRYSNVAGQAVAGLYGMGRGALGFASRTLSPMMNVLGGTSLEQGLGAVPLIGGFIQANLGALSGAGADVAQVEIPTLQLNYMSSGKIQDTLFNAKSVGGAHILGLSSELGISPSQSAQILTQSANASGGIFVGAREAVGLTARGLDPTQVAGMVGTQRLFGLGQDMIGTVGALSDRGYRGSIGTTVAQSALQFATARRSAGLSRVNVSSVAGRMARSGDPMFMLGALGGAQNVAQSASQQAAAPLQGLAGSMLMASAMEQTGGDYSRAIEVVRNMSPEAIFGAMRGLGVDQGTANLALQGSGMTLEQIKILRGTKAGSLAPVDVTTGIDEATRVSRAMTLDERVRIKALTAPGGKGVERLEALTGVNAALQANQLMAGLSPDTITALGNAYIDANKSVVVAIEKNQAELVKVVRLLSRGASVVSSGTASVVGTAVDIVNSLLGDGT